VLDEHATKFVACLLDTPQNCGMSVTNTPQNVVKCQLPRGNTPRAYSLTLLSLSRQDPPPHGKTQPVCISLSLSLSLTLSLSLSHLSLSRPAPPKTLGTHNRPRPPTVSACLSNFFFFSFQLYIQYLYICLIYVK